MRRLWPRQLLRSDVYWRIMAFEQRHGWHAAYQRRRGRPPQERVIQDVEIPLERTADFLRWFGREVPIEPVWLCPVRLRAGAEDAWGSPAHKMQFARGVLTRTPTHHTVRSAGAQGSHVFASLAAANCLVIVPPETTRVVPGQELLCLPIGPVRHPDDAEIAGPEAVTS